MLKNKKKAQIGIFVIIAVILLLVSVFLFSQNKVDFFTSTKVKQTNQFIDVINYCVEISAEQGLFLLGFQGGYIEIPQEILLNPNRVIDLGLQMPNWDTQRGEIPTIITMENELNQYIFNNINGCIESNFQTLKNEFEINYTFDNLILDTQINKENVQIQVNFPITFKAINAEEIIELSDFFINLENLRLGNLYELALEIYNLELRTNLFEELTLEQIHSASDYSTSSLSMPSEGMSFTCSKMIWTKDQLKRNLANLNNNNFKYLHFEGTYFNNLVFDANLNEDLETFNFRDYYDRQYRFNLLRPQDSFQNYKVDVVMPSTEITSQQGYLQRYPFREFDVTPSSGQIVKPISMSINLGAKIPIPCIQIYHHLYTLDYDLIVTLTDMNIDGNGYFFQFPIRVQLEENAPKQKAFSFTSSIFDELTATSDSYCEQSQMLYPVHIYVQDINSQQFLSNVNISYSCMSLTCEMNNTQKPFFRGIEREFAQPKLEANFPFCIGGKVIAKKEGFHQLPNKEFLETNSDLLERNIPLQYDVEMVSIKEFEITKDSVLAVYKETREATRIYDETDGNVFISIENPSLNFYSQAMIPNNAEHLNKIQLLELNNVKYNISIIYVDKDSNLRGIYEAQDVNLNSNSGNNIQFIIPASNQEINEEKFIEFYEYMESTLSNSNYGVKIN